MLVTQDHVIPYMLDSRHIPDTLFIILEETFRLFPSEGEPIAPDLPPSAGHTFLYPRDSDLGAASSSRRGTLEESCHKVSMSSLQWQARVGVPPDVKKKEADGAHRPQPVFATRANKESRAAHSTAMSPHLEALVRICNTAHRLTCGDLVWFSWNDEIWERKSKHEPSPSWGSHGIACTVSGAKWLQQEIPRMDLWHWDEVLKKRLQLGEAKACFIFPSVGHFASSGEPIASKTTWRQKNNWKAWWVQKGVVPDDDDDFLRSIWRWGKPAVKGEVELERMVDVILHEPAEWPHLDWKTYFHRDPTKNAGSPSPPREAPRAAHSHRRRSHSRRSRCRIWSTWRSTCRW